MWLYWCITGFCIILVGSVIAGAVYMTRGPKGAYPGGSGSPPSELLPIRQPPPLKPRKIWIVYSADHPLYVDVVLKFAQFMITVCGTEVALDLLEERQISEVGAMRWLSRQKKEMEELSSKIIILCSRGTRAKWQAMLGNEGMAVSLRQDQRQPAGDLFTPALNLILPDFKKPACFGTYIVCYFEGISDQKDIPDPFNVTSKYQLMDRFEDIYFLIQDLEKFEPGQIHQIPEIAAENYTASLSGKKLKEAVQRFQKWQVEHPNWFERERCCSEDEEDLQSLDQQILEELMLADGGILKRQLLLQEPDSSGCCLVDLHMKEDEDTACRLQPQLNPQGDPACQSTLIVIDEAPRVHVVEPVALVEGENAVSHQLLTSEDWMGEVALLEASAPRRNSILLHEDLDDPTSNDQQAEHHLPDDVRQQLKGLMYSLYQQSITPYEPPLCQEALEQQQLVFDDSSKEQRQSVQSDQGYISRCSPLPSSDDPVEEKEGQEQESLIPAPHFSPDILESLKSLQQQLLFQEIQQNSGWEHTDEMMDTCHSIQGS
uniref:Interleukin 17 receptor A n=1 Tax=Sphenodon punctatus TaxID=8508 RepID=A0A8D0GYB0_SPHPU